MIIEYSDKKQEEINKITNFLLLNSLSIQT